tara:strand:+ start:13374 stop:15359 length:1986 start_codon:yes stop_codon:yes gene_type:complete
MAIPNYYSYKKIYTSGDMFTLTGSDFYGFAETADGIAKEPSTGKTLVPKSTYKTDLFYTEYFKDRVVSDIDLTLPNTKDECLFNLNDNFNYDLFKYKLEKVRDNNSFVYSKLFIPSNKLPFASTLRYATVPTVNAQEFTINISDNNNPAFISNKKFSQNYYLSAFGNIVAATAQTNSHSTSNAFALFAATTTNLICLTGDDNKLTIIEDSTGYESNENDLAFNEIGGLASTKDFLYLSDTGNNVVLKYDIAGYSNNDSSLRNRRNYIELVGGFGGETRQTKFLRPTKLAATSTELAVFDSGNKVIKLFDSDLNFITRITSINFNTETFGAMGFDPDFGSLYVVTFRDITTNDITVRTTYLYRFSGKGYRFKEEFILDDTLSIKDKEEVNSLSFSGTDSNYWYFGTNKTIYKKFKTRPVEVIGKFRTQRLYLLNYADTTQEVVNTEEIVTINNRWNFNDINFSNANFNWNIGTAVAGEGLQETAEIDGLLDDNITSFSIFPGTSSFDRAIMLTTGRLFFFDEPTASAYQRVLKDSNYNNYGSAGFSLNTDSFIQQSIVNTELYKVLNDILNIKNNIIGRFTGKFKNDILELDDYNYEVDFNQILTQGIENLYVHGNEENLTGVLNRCFSLIYELQAKLINIVQVNVEANVQPSFTLVDSIKI